MKTFKQFLEKAPPKKEGLYKFKITYSIPKHGDSYSYFSTLTQANEWAKKMKELPKELRPINMKLHKV
jgi:hypothetical protein